MSTTLLKSLATAEDIKHIIINDYSEQTFGQLEDAQGEITDSVMPIYYSDIIGEWQAMPSEYDGQGVAEFGLPEPKNISVYKLMELDLYLYYSNLVSRVLWELQDAGHFESTDETI